MEKFEDVFHQYASPVYRFLLKLTHNEDAAEELTQETFFKAFIHIDSFKGKSSAYTWLCQIGKNLYMNELRRRKRVTDCIVDDSVPDSQDIEQQAIDRAQISAVLNALKTLPEQQQEVFSLRIFGELKYKEIGFLLEKSETWAKVTFFRVKEQLIKEMEDSKWI